MRSVMGAPSRSRGSWKPSVRGPSPTSDATPKRVIFFMQNQGFDPKTCIPEGLTNSGSLGTAKLPEPIRAIDRVGSIDIIGRSGGSGPRILVVSIGAMAGAALAATSVTTADVTIIDPRWVLPISEELIDFVEGFDAIVTIEDGLRDGGVGQQIADLASCPVTVLGVSRHFIDHASRKDILAREHMTGDDVITAVRAAAGHGPALSIASDA